MNWFWDPTRFSKRRERYIALWNFSGLPEDGASSIDGPDHAAIRAYRCSFSYLLVLNEVRDARYHLPNRRRRIAFDWTPQERHHRGNEVEAVIRLLDAQSPRHARSRQRKNRMGRYAEKRPVI